MFFAGAALAAQANVGLPDKAVTRTTLDNGLTLLVEERPPEGLVAIDVKILAGSGDEAEYLASGISHLVEHMVFKGTETRGAGQIEKEIKSYGGLINGSVSQDITDYRVTIPSQYLDKGLTILQDMLLNANFDKREFDKEKDVILSEVRLNKDEPERQLFRLTNETAYLYHAYRYPPIGYEENFNKLSVDDALRYYNRMYVPNKMVISIVGDIKTTDALRTAGKIFSNFRRPNYAVSSQYLSEPKQIGKRARDESADINLAYAAYAFHSTGVLDEDLFAMDLLSMILGRGDNSRLNTQLKKNKRIAYSISCWNYTPKDPGLFVIMAVLDKENVGSCESTILDEIEKLKRGAISDEEIEGAKRMVLADYIFSRENIDDEAADLSQDYILTGSIDFSKRYVTGIEKVTREDLKRVADKYLKIDNLTVIRLMPRGYQPLQSGETSSAFRESPLKLTTLANGLKIIVRENTKAPIVSLTMVIGGGVAEENSANNGISNIVSKMLLKGTAARKEKDIVGAVEAMGGNLSAFSGFNAFGLNLEVLKGDLDRGIDMLGDIVFNSTFSEEELDKEKSIVLAMIRQEEDDIFRKGFEAVRSELFAPSPYGLRILGEAGSIKALNRNMIASFYKKFTMPSNMVISVSGDIDTADVINKLTKVFSELKSGKIDISPAKEITRIDKTIAKTLKMDKEQSLVSIGFQTANVKNPDRYCLDVIGSILSGYSGRLFSELRDKAHLSYALGSIQKYCRDTGFSIIYIATSVNRVEDAKNGLVEVIKGIKNDYISDEELTLAKRELITNYEIASQTNLFYSHNSALDELYGTGYDNLYKYKSMIDKVTKDDVRRVCRKYYDLDSCAELIITPK
ncbi:MAG: pitrilysin family protein [Candidatus Omnitrophota bacterium]|jgi:zinc protease